VSECKPLVHGVHHFRVLDNVAYDHMGHGRAVQLTVSHPR